MSEIKFHGSVSVEFDVESELSFDCSYERRFFYLTAQEAVQLRDFLIAATASNPGGKS